MITELANHLIEDLFQYSQKEIMTPANLGILKSGTQDKLVDALDEININKLVHLETRKKYDEWFNGVVEPFHGKLLPLYRKNLVIDKDNPFTYSARLLTHYVRILCIRTWLYGAEGERFIRIQHPQMTNTFLKSFPEINASRVNQIKGKEDYYSIVEYYRKLIDLDECDKNRPLLEMELGVDF